MKAILVIDMPTHCGECQFCGFGGRNLEKYVCCLTKEHSESPHLVGCPLKPMPQKKVVTVKRIEDIQSYSITEVADKISAKIILKTDEVFALGWNACLEEIQK